MDVDLSVKWMGLTFKNPVLPASCENAMDVPTVRKCIKNGAGGIITKSYTHIAGMRGSYLPTFSFADPVDPQYKGLLLYGVGFGPKSPERVLKEEMPGMRKLCTEAEIPLVASLAPNLEEDKLVMLARQFDEAGADALELDLGCNIGDWKLWIDLAKELGLTERQYLFGYHVFREHFDETVKEIKAVKDAISVPLSIKLHPYVGVDKAGPLQYCIKKVLDAGADGLSCFDALGGGAIIDVENESQYFCCWPTGGTVGPALRPLSVGKIIAIKGLFPEADISGIGGIQNGKHAIQYVLIGCPTVQIGSGIYYFGYSLFNRVVNGIASWMKRKGYSTVDEFLGKALEKFGYPEKGRVYGTPEDKPFPYVPRIDLEKCTYCGLCQDVCGYDVISVNREKKAVKIHRDECWSCAKCVGVCPVAAIVLIDKKTGDVIWDNAGQAKTHVAVKPWFS